jgi:hypothetical protein
VGTVGANNHNVVQNFTIIIVTFDSFLKYFPSTRFLTLFNIRIGQIVPRFKILKKSKYVLNINKLLLTMQFSKYRCKKGFKNGASLQTHALYILTEL